MTSSSVLAPSRSRTAIGFLLRRWPAVLVVALEVVSWGIGTVRAGQILPLLPALVVLAVLRRRGATWPVLATRSPRRPRR